MLFMGPGLALYLWRAPEARRWLRRPVFWGGAGLAALVFTPVVVWNVRQGWVTVRHVARQGRGSGLSAVYPAEFLASQIGVLSPIVALLLLWGLWAGIREGLFRRREPYRFLVAWAAPVLLFYGVLSLQGKIQANWAVAAYPSLALVTAGLLVEHRDGAVASGRRAQDRLVAAAAGLALLVVLLGHVTEWLPIPPRFDPTTRLRGWAELGAEAGRLRAAMPRPAQTILLSDQYQVTSELAFYVPGHPPAYNLPLGRRRNQYDLWDAPADRLGWDALYVEEGVRLLDTRVMAAFDRVDEPVVLEIRRAGRVVRSFSLYRGYGFRGLPDEAAPVRY
jgi:undecaprenyl-diphosphatase